MVRGRTGRSILIARAAIFQPWSVVLNRSYLKKRSKFACDFAYCFRAKLADKLGVPDAPFKTLHLVGENDTAELKSGGNGHFERSAFHLARHRAKNCESKVIHGITACRNVAASHYQISRPTDGPKSTSA